MATKNIGGVGYINTTLNGDVTGVANKFIGGTATLGTGVSGFMQTVGTKPLSSAPFTLTSGASGDFRYTIVSAVSGQGATQFGATGSLGVATVSQKQFAGTTSITTSTGGGSTGGPGTAWYVSKAAAGGGNGTSWATAWNELDQINWTSVLTGDTVYIDGGPSSCPSNYNFTGPRPGVSSGMMYTTTLTPTRNGVTIRRSTEAGRNGTVVLYGGRPIPLPYCGQTAYTPGGTGSAQLINIGAVSNVVIDGVTRSGIMGYGAQCGIEFSSDSAANATIRNIELFDNGIPVGTTSFSSDGENVTLRGTGHTFDRVMIHDGGQDNFQSASTGTSGLTWKNSWLYFNREHPTNPGITYNYPCTHTDSIQLYSGGRQSGLTLDYCVFGPGANQGFYPSDGDPALLTRYDNVSITNTSFFAAHHNIISDLAIHGWTIDHCTIYATDGGSELPADGAMTLTNNIKYGGYWVDTGGTWTASGNVYWTGDPIQGATNTNPNFIQVTSTGAPPPFSEVFAADLTPTNPAVVGKGSPLHRVSDIVTRIDSLNGTGQAVLTVATGFAGSVALTFDVQGDQGTGFPVAFVGSAGIALTPTATMRLATRFAGSTQIQTLASLIPQGLAAASFQGSTGMSTATVGAMRMACSFDAVALVRLDTQVDLRVRLPLYAYPYFRPPVVRIVPASYLDPTGKDEPSHYADVPEPINRLMSRYRSVDRAINLFIMEDGSVTDQQPPNWNPNAPTDPVSQGWNPFTHTTDTITLPPDQQVRRVLYGGVTSVVSLAEATLLAAAGYGDFLTTEA